MQAFPLDGSKPAAPGQPHPLHFLCDAVMPLALASCRGCVMSSGIHSQPMGGTKVCAFVQDVLLATHMQLTTCHLVDAVIWDALKAVCETDDMQTGR
jgi:hypothetical protein